MPKRTRPKICQMKLFKWLRASLRMVRSRMLRLKIKISLSMKKIKSKVNNRKMKTKKVMRMLTVILMISADRP